jgi:uncharacterized protein (DUF2062 family)
MRQGFDRFIRLRGSPKEIAYGFAIGILISLTPTMGIQTPTVIILSAIFKWNKISAIMGVWITNAFTAPFIYGITYMTGAKILNYDNVQPIDFSLSTFVSLLKSAPEMFLAMAVGGIIWGIPLSLLSYFIAYFSVRKYQESMGKKRKGSDRTVN